MRYCRYCGGEVSDSAKACGHCGHWLAVEPTTPPPAEVRKEARHTEPLPVVPPPDELVLGEPEELEPDATVPRVGVAPPETRKVKPEPPALSRAETPAFASRPKRRIPVWAWGLGAVVIILIAGAALVINGAIGLPGQQPTQARSAPSLVATSRPTRAPSSVPTPRVEPVAVLLGREDATKTVEADQPVIVEWVWGVCDPALLEENITAVEFKVTLDRFGLAAGNMARYRTEVREEELSGLHAWWQYYAYPLGSFRSGSSHSFELERGFSQQVTDGCDLDGDGNPDWYGPDSVVTTRLDLTVQ